MATTLPIKVFTLQELLPYFRGQMTHYFYKECDNKYQDFLPHSDGKTPLRIIDKQRPNEPDKVKEFRLLIWEPITKPSFSSVISSLGKIRRSSDWAIVYPTEKFDLITDGESLEDYCEKNYPYFTSITNWVFNVLLKQYLIDANAVILITPLITDGLEETDYLNPFTYLYNSCDVVAFQDQQYAILKISSGCVYTDEKGNIKIGRSYYVITSVRIERWDEIDDKGNFSISYEYNHNLYFLPAFKVGGVICDSDGTNFIYESRISGILPNLNEAVSEYTDLQAGKRLNIYPERWEYTQHECPKCKGSGRIINPHWREGDSLELAQMSCSNCHNGYIASGPFSKLLIRPTEAGAAPIPTPPAGYIEKDIEIIKLMSESVDAHIYKALASINFQFLQQTPLNQSGVAKEVDKDELNNTVHAIAEDLIAIMDKIYKTIARYRYINLYSIDDIDKMVPRIPVPEHFDLISSQYMQDEIKRSRDSQMNDILISQMEVEFTAKRFAQDDDINKIIRLTHKLDPLPGISTEEKMSMISNKTITRENNIISDNIVSYLRRALFENPDFDEWEYDRQLELLDQYAEEQIAETDTATNIVKTVLSNDQNQPPAVESLPNEQPITVN